MTLNIFKLGGGGGGVANLEHTRIRPGQLLIPSKTVTLSLGALKILKYRSECYVNTGLRIIIEELRIFPLSACCGLHYYVQYSI
jgi:hypothetical protein